MEGTAALEGKRILLLEDDTDSRESMAMLLELAGAKVVSTPTAEDALAALQHTEFDAVVTDVAMPGRSGFWLVGQIRQLGAQPTIPVLAVTGHPFPRDGMLRAGFDEQMLKPVAPNVLYQTLTQLMRRPDARPPQERPISRYGKHPMVRHARVRDNAEHGLRNDSPDHSPQARERSSPTRASRQSLRALAVGRSV